MFAYCLCSSLLVPLLFLFFFFNDTATTEIYTLSLHDALPISSPSVTLTICLTCSTGLASVAVTQVRQDRKSTRLNSSHVRISYAVFCLKKKKTHESHPGKHYEESCMMLQRRQGVHTAIAHTPV